MRIPKMQHFKAKDLARVRLPQAGRKARIVYLGKWGTEEARQRYDEVIAQWLLKQRRTEAVALTMNRLCLAYLEYCQEYYRKDGEPTSEVHVMRLALRQVTQACGRVLTRDFGPSWLRAIRENMIDLDWTRDSINHHINRICGMLKWGVSRDFVPPDVLHRCQAVESLARGRTRAKESSPVPPAPLADVKAVEPFVSRQVWAMIQLQLETAMRPGEVRTLTLSNLERSRDESWEYLPARHKTQHHGRERRIYLNRKAQQIILPFFKADPAAPLFSPKDAYNDWIEKKREDRKTPVQPSQKDRRIPNPRRTAGDVYSKDSYARAIRRACELAKVDSWSPNQLRHTAATLLERRFGEDTARCVLGHSSKSTTQVYVEEDFEKARRAMEQWSLPVAGESA